LLEIGRPSISERNEKTPKGSQNSQTVRKLKLSSAQAIRDHILSSFLPDRIKKHPSITFALLTHQGV
jgi:hypothetical protein